MKTENLYRVTLVGMHQTHGISYVVASDPSMAYEIVYDDLNERNIGYRKDRVLSKVELIASNEKYPDSHVRLYIQEVDVREEINNDFYQGIDYERNKS